MEPAKVTKYRYTVVRYVPNTTRGEFINVAVIVVKDPNELAIRILRNGSRAEAISEPGFDYDSFQQQWVATIAEGLLDGSVKSMEAYLEQLYRDWGNVLQLKSLCPAIGASAEDVADMLTPVFLCEDDAQVRSK